MTSRRALARVLAGALALGLSGCVGAPPAKPSTSAPAFASDREAYAAAEKTYRAYVDALNHVDLADPKTFEPVFALTTGEANAADRKNLSQMHADGWVVRGETRVTALVASERPDGSVGLSVCTNVRDITLVNSSGVSMVSPDRSDTPGKLVVVEQTLKGPKISGFFARNDEPRCGD